jgi:site-specific recombinase XerC
MADTPGRRETSHPIEVPDPEASDPNSASRGSAHDQTVICTSLRISELHGIDCGDVVLGTGTHVRCEGKGRNQ